MRIKLGLLWLCVLSALSGGCSESEGKSTQVVVSVDADQTLRGRLTRVEVETYDPAAADEGGKPTLIGSQSFTLDPAERDSVTFAFSFGVVKNKANQFLLVVMGFEGSQLVVEQKARIGFSEGQSRKVEILLLRACYQQLCAERGTSEWYQNTCDREQGVCRSVATQETTVIVEGAGDAQAANEDGAIASEAGPGKGDAEAAAPEGAGFDGGFDASFDASLDASSPSSDAGMTADAGTRDAAMPADAAQTLDGASASDAGSKDAGSAPDATTNANDCLPTSCPAPHSCVDGVNDYSCMCGAGYFQLTAKTCALSLVSIAAGGDASYARRSDGSVVAWGRNAYGQFGNGTTMSSSVPVVIAPLASAVEIAGSEYFMCARRSNGTVACAGFNSEGELGNGTTTSSPALVEVSGLSNAAEIAVGYEHACARRTDGTVVCWGKNGSGQLGNGMMGEGVRSAVPVTVTGLTNVAEIALGGYHSCARRSDNTVVCWGANGQGQLGNDSTSNSASFVQVSGLSNAAGLALGDAHSCARLGTGSVVCWGYGFHGQLGNALSTDSPVPVPVTGLTGVAEISAFLYYSCARTNDGTVSCWGARLATPTSVSTPLAITGVSGAVELGAGRFHSCARRSNGSAVCWGVNEYGQLGDGTMTNTPSAVAVRAN